MNITKSLFRFLVPLMVIATPMLTYGQTEISRKTELQTGTATPIPAGSTGTRDRNVPQVGIRGIPGVRTEGMPAPGAGRPGTRTFTQEVEIITFGYQIPDFNPEDLYTHIYRFGMFSESANGSGTVYPDTDGYVEYKMRHPVEQNEMQTFLYSVHAETGEAQVFIDVNDLSVNKAVSILTNVALNARPNAVRYQSAGSRLQTPRTFHIPPEIGNQRRMELRGDYLTLDDIQEEIFRQTRCNVEVEDGRYYLQSCR